jgi:hypothetical protein
MEHKAFLFNMIQRGECCNALMDMYDVIFATLFVTHWVRHGYVNVFWNWVLLSWMYGAIIWNNWGVLCPVCYLWSEDPVCLWFSLSMSGMSASDFRLNDIMVDTCHDMVDICPCSSGVILTVIHNLGWAGVFLCCCNVDDLFCSGVHHSKGVILRLSSMDPQNNCFNG